LPSRGNDEVRLYRELAPWFRLLTAPASYVEEAELYGNLLVEMADGPVSTVLELGSGGGNNASHLKARFELTLVDRSPEMLELSRGLNPELEHIEGDMRSVRLGRTFDGVFVHDAIAYILTEPDLEAVFETVAVHCRPGGSAVLVPDYVQETFAPRTSHGGHDSEDGERGLRYLEWVRADPSDATRHVVDFAYVLREGEDVRVEQDRHVCGLFPRETWLRGLDAAGFDLEVIEPRFDDEPTGQVVFACRRPG
jgi:SAM-dependent methyltransferase